ncbi:MFS transporter [Microbacterium dextranolyticum]|uniref:MFS transporter n=1 Tax=Microbacterium dextranolyticum TaxID=36806 RepID=A0A9W6HJG0_9MICO|nr:MFS transporter [Microbacterium dextranolyticum]MBM7461862.1 inositol transporter-like SP family MFS transporter [Microbacterium dextranolyticum]GLJ94103.1 MFS transporter [Microbacterium dextranolyticum]
MSATLARTSPNPWWVGFVCGMATFVDAAATTGIAVALVLFQSPAPGAAGLTFDQVGLLTGVLTAGVAVGSLVGGRLADRFGRRRVFLVTMTLIVLGSLTPFLGVSIGLLLPGIALIGLGVGADLPAALASISEAATDRNRGKILVFSNLLGGFGILLAVLIGIFFGALGETGGRIMFAAFGGVGIVVLLLRLTIPESASWIAARDERLSGVQTVRAERGRLRDFGRAPYRRPFVTLLVYYTLASVAVSVAGSFGPFVAVNVAGIPVNEYQTWTLLAMPAAILGAVWFMAVADTRWRMSYFVAGSIAVVAANLVPVVFGFTLPALIVSVLVSTFAGAFCFETIMKVWTQESFPTMLRSTAQGTVYAVARFATAGFNVVTPALLVLNPSGVYAGVSIVAALGFFIGWVGFRRGVRNEFDVEDRLVTAASPVAPVLAGDPLRP